MIKYFILFILLLTFLSSVTGQMVLEYKDRIAEKHYESFLAKELLIEETKDELERGKIYYELGKKCLRYQEELALKYELIAQRIFKENDQDSLYHLVTCSMSYPYIGLGEYDKAEANLKEGLIYWESHQNKRWLGHTHLKMAHLFKQRGDFVKALRHNLEGYRIHKSYRPIEEMGTTVSGLVNLYRKVGDCETAVRYASEYINSDSSLNSKGYVKLIKHNVADCVRKIGYDSLATVYENETAMMYINSSSFKLKSYSYLNLAELNSSDKALKLSYIDSAYHFARLFGNGRYISSAYAAYFLHWFEEGEEAKALLSLDSMLVNAQAENYLDGIMNCYQNYSEFYSKQGDYKKAFLYDNKADSINKIFFSDEISNDLKKLDLSIQQSQNEEKVKLLEEQNRLKEINLTNERRIKFGLAALLFLVLGIVFLLYKIIKSRAKRNVELTQKNDTISKALASNKMLIKEIHHRVKNNLQVVSSLLFLQSRFVNDENAKGAIQTGRSRVQAMSILHQKLYKKDNLKSVNIKEYFEDLTQNLFQTYNLFENKVVIEVFVEDIELDIDTVVPLGLIVNELISNALKHAFDEKSKGVIILSIEKKENRLYMSVKDNGKGLPFNQIPDKTDSLGMELIKSFSEKLEADIFIDNTNGTQIEISFKLP